MESGGDTRSLLDFCLPKRRLLEESLLMIEVCGDVPSLNCIQKGVELRCKKSRKMKIRYREMPAESVKKSEGIYLRCPKSHCNAVVLSFFLAQPAYNRENEA